MNPKNLGMLPVVVLLLVSCASEVTSNPPATSPIATPATQSSSPVAQSPQPENRSGTFVSGEHDTKGTVRLVTQNGKTTVELDAAFKTSDMGPDLVVALHRSSDVVGSSKPPAYPLKEGDYVVIAPLQKFSGGQRYAIPDTVNLANYQSVVIWCRKFNATFGSAKLS